MIETSRLLIRPVAGEDVMALHELFNLAQVRQYLFDDQETSHDRVKELIEASQGAFAERGFGLFAVLPAKGDEIVGFCGFLPEKVLPELIYALHPEHWGKDLATEAASAVMDWGFRDHGFDEIYAAADAPNEASIRVMQKIGMRYHENRIENGVECVYYKVTRSEFYE